MSNRESVIQDSGSKYTQVQQSGHASVVQSRVPKEFELSPGTLFADRYTVQKLIAHGGMGSVYLANDANTNEDVCLKLIRPEYISTPDSIERFLAEGRIARKLTHPNVAKVFDIDKKNGIWFISMEYAKGYTLREWFQKRRLAGKLCTVSEVLWFANRVLKILAYLHKNSVIHRDLKPENIILADKEDGSRTLKLVDFGVAKELREDALRNTMTGVVVGTLGYMSPEQRAGAPVDQRTDLYAVGVVLYELFTGALYDGNWEPISDLRSDVPKEIGDVLKSALSKFPTNRPSSASEFLGQLEMASSSPTNTPQAQKKVPKPSDATVNPKTLLTVSVVLLLSSLVVLGTSINENAKNQARARSIDRQLQRVQELSDEVFKSADSTASAATSIKKDAELARTSAKSARTNAKEVEHNLLKTEKSVVLAREHADKSEDSAELAQSHKNDAKYHSDAAKKVLGRSTGKVDSNAGNSDAEIALIRKLVKEANSAAARAEKAASESKGAEVSNQGNGIPAGKESWRKLKIGMTRDQVRKLLGEPEKIDGGTLEYWYYSSDDYGPEVVFHKDGVYSWDEPD